MRRCKIICGCWKGVFPFFQITLGLTWVTIDVEKQTMQTQDEPGMSPHVQAIVKPRWADSIPEIFQAMLPGFPYMLPLDLLPPRDCANCLFHRDDWRGGGFCYMFKAEPTGNNCGQFKSV